MRIDPAGRRFPGASLLLALPALVFAFLPGLAARCTLERRAVEGGQVWRLVTGHWTHWSGDHLLWDLAAFAVLAAACELRGGCGRRRMLAAVGLATVVLPLVLGVALPGMSSYRGLSGIDSALFVLLAASLVSEERAAGRRGGALWGSLALAAFLAKCGYEVATGRALFTATAGAAGGWVPVPLAHLAGGLCGLALAPQSWGRCSPLLLKFEKALHCSCHACAIHGQIRSVGVERPLAPMPSAPGARPARRVQRPTRGLPAVAGAAPGLPTASARRAGAGRQHPLRALARRRAGPGGDLPAARRHTLEAGRKADRVDRLRRDELRRKAHRLCCEAQLLRARTHQLIGESEARRAASRALLAASASEPEPLASIA